MFKSRPIALVHHIFYLDTAFDWLDRPLLFPIPFRTEVPRLFSLTSDAHVNIYTNTIPKTSTYSECRTEKWAFS